MTHYQEVTLSVKKIGRCWKGNKKLQRENQGKLQEMRAEAVHAFESMKDIKY